jgi:glycosyltransferase involved in cell wall biosynthesis
MKIIYYTQPWFLDHVAHQVQALSRKAETHVMLELSPEAWNCALFDVAPRSLPSGLTSADSVLKEWFPLSFQEYWKDVASFKLVVHNCRRSIHPASWWVSHQAMKFARSIQPDIFHVNDVSMRLAFAIAELGSIPLVITLHDPEPHSGEHNWRTRPTRKLFFRRARHFILHSENLKQAFCAEYRIPPSSVEVIRLGTYSSYREWSAKGPAPDGPTVLFFGRLSPYKGLNVLYQAAPYVADSVPGVRFVIAGKSVTGYQPPPPPALPNSGRIEVLNHYISNEELACLFQRATLVVCPYLDATQSGIVLTAYAFGKPVVATRVGGLPEYVEDGTTGALVPPNQAFALAQAITKLLLNDGERQKMEASIAAKNASEFSWDRIMSQTLSLYERIGRQNSPQPLQASQIL